MHASAAATFPDASATVSSESVVIVPHEIETQSFLSCRVCRVIVFTLAVTVVVHKTSYPNRFRARSKDLTQSWMSFFNFAFASFELAQIGSTESGGSVHSVFTEPKMFTSVAIRRYLAS